jgi:hypothetical protein
MWNERVAAAISLVGAASAATINYSTVAEIVAIDPPVEDTIHKPTDPAILARLTAAFPDFRRAMDPVGLEPAEFRGAGRRIDSAHCRSAGLGQRKERTGQLTGCRRESLLGDSRADGLPARHEVVAEVLNGPEFLEAGFEPAGIRSFQGPGAREAEQPPPGC